MHRVLPAPTPSPEAGDAGLSPIDELLGNYSDLRAYLRGRLGNPADAADIAQSSFAQVYAYLLDHPVRNVRALLFQAARNLWVDVCRRRNTEADVLRTWQITQDHEVPDTARIVGARSELKQLIRRIERMPRLRREVFSRVRLQGQSHVQVSAELGLTARAVEQHVARAVFDLAELVMASSAA